MNKESLKAFLISRNISLNEECFDELESFMNYTLCQNEKFNLTSIEDESTFYEKMILDSLLGFYDIDITGKKVIDVGTGAGYPGMALYIANKDVDITLLDSTKKKIDSLMQYADIHNYDLTFIADRAEIYSREHSEEYDFAVARAVASLPVLLEIVMPLLKVGGCFICYKGSEWKKEYNNSSTAFKKLGCSLKKVYEDTLPESKEERAILMIRKDKKTNKKYPREYRLIKAKSL